MGVDHNSQATAAALARAKEIIRAGGTTAEAAAAAKEVARAVLKAQKSSSFEDDSGDSGNASPESGVLADSDNTLLASHPGDEMISRTRKSKKNVASLTDTSQKKKKALPPLGTGSNSATGGGGGGKMWKKLRKKITNAKAAISTTSTKEVVKTITEEEDEVEENEENRDEEQNQGRESTSKTKGPNNRDTSLPQLSSNFRTDSPNSALTPDHHQVVYYERPGSFPTSRSWRNNARGGNDDSISTAEELGIEKNTNRNKDSGIMGAFLTAVDSVLFPVDGHASTVDDLSSSQSDRNLRSRYKGGSGKNGTLPTLREGDEGDSGGMEGGGDGHGGNFFVNLCCGQHAYLPSVSSETAERNDSTHRQASEMKMANDEGESREINNTGNEDDDRAALEEDNDMIQTRKTISWADSPIVDAHYGDQDIKISTHSNDSSLLNAMRRGVANGNKADNSQAGSTTEASRTAASQHFNNQYDLQRQDSSRSSKMMQMLKGGRSNRRKNDGKKEEATQDAVADNKSNKNGITEEIPINWRDMVADTPPSRSPTSAAHLNSSSHSSKPDGGGLLMMNPTPSYDAQHLNNNHLQQQACYQGQQQVHSGTRLLPPSPQQQSGVGPYVAAGNAGQWSSQLQQPNQGQMQTNNSPVATGVLPMQPSAGVNYRHHQQMPSVGHNVPEFLLHHRNKDAFDVPDLPSINSNFSEETVKEKKDRYSGLTPEDEDKNKRLLQMKKAQQRHSPQALAVRSSPVNFQFNDSHMQQRYQQLIIQQQHQLQQQMWGIDSNPNAMQAKYVPNNGNFGQEEQQQPQPQSINVFGVSNDGSFGQREQLNSVPESNVFGTVYDDESINMNNIPMTMLMGMPLAAEAPPEQTQVSTPSSNRQKDVVTNNGPSLTDTMVSQQQAVDIAADKSPNQVDATANIVTKIEHQTYPPSQENNPSIGDVTNNSQDLPTDTDVNPIVAKESEQKVQSSLHLQNKQSIDSTTKSDININANNASMAVEGQNVHSYHRVDPNSTDYYRGNEVLRTSPLPIRTFAV